MIHEYVCGKCGETFVGGGDDYESHDFTGMGIQCDGLGELAGTWAPVTVEADDEQGA